MTDAEDGGLVRRNIASDDALHRDDELAGCEGRVGAAIGMAP